MNLSASFVHTWYYVRVHNVIINVAKDTMKSAAILSRSFIDAFGLRLLKQITFLNRFMKSINGLYETICPTISG